MANGHSIDYAIVLSDLKAKRAEIDKTIIHLENLSKMGILNPNDAKQDIDKKEFMFHSPTISNLANMGVYDATIVVLEKIGSPMKTAEIHEVLVENGKSFASSDPNQAVGVTLYKAVKQKNDPKIKLIGQGIWALSKWKD